MLIADLNEFVWFTNAAAYANGHAADGTPYEVVILRATYSTCRVDNKYVANLTQARQAGLLVGHYGYMAAADDPSAAGRFFGQTLRANGPLKIGDTVWCDCEEGTGDQAPRVQAFLQAAHQVLGDNVADEGFYSGASFFAVHLGTMPTGVHRWIASYGSTAPPDGEVLFQFTDKQTMPGVSAPCDCSIFDGTVDQYRTTFGWAPQPSPTAPSTAPVADPEVDNMVKHLINLPVGPDGTGWTPSPLPYPFATVVDVAINPGNRAAGQPATPGTVKAADWNGGTYVEIEGGTPHATYGVWVTVTGQG